MSPAELPPQPSAVGLGEVGVDIVLTQRVRTMLTDHGERILTRMLTPAELEDCCKEGRLDLLSVAGRLAAKEAAFKTLAVPGSALPWLGMEVRRAAGGRPTLHLSGAARNLAAQAGVSDVRISISHDGDYAVAVAAAARTPEPTSLTAPSAPKGKADHGHPPEAAQGLDPQAAPRA
ncbi:holo-ACP synthase [Streptomyces sp. V1I1]|uniref:holo-ACP synthase n=1 Tax=Streptomyces sp. V1I1 TaxID=3042272 RepID=UPI0027860894|nr:holo-ACP synthase [Streptomyces sp. V1I1]MDQ0939277.1 holo-[acyl-carrier protein] synthase [Streptomyces sp. V1I1]